MVVLTSSIFGSANRIFVRWRIRGGHRGALFGGFDRRGALRSEAARFAKETARDQGSEKRVNIQRGYNAHFCERSLILMLMTCRG